MMYLVVGVLAVCAVLCAALLHSAGQKAWGGAVLGIVLGPLGVALAVWVALAHKPSASS